MENEDPYKRQYDQAGYPSGQNFGQVSRNGAGGDASDRFRQLQISSIKPPISGPRMSAEGQSQGQQQHAPQLQGAGLQYRPDFSQEPQRAQQYTQYPSNLMYNMSQQAPQQSSYEPIQQFQPRPSAVVEARFSQFDVLRYHPPSDPTSVPSPMTQCYVSAPFQQQIAYQQPGHTGHAAFLTAHPAGMTEDVQPNVPDILEQPESRQDAGSYDTAYRQYIKKLRATFQDLKDKKLVEAGQSLLEISEFLLGQAVELGKRSALHAPFYDPNIRLGLTKDEEELHDERIKLWNDFNTCWLAVLQKQKDITQNMIDLGQSPVPPQYYLRKSFLEKMGGELVRLCDGMERHGLVDYEMGVWEEEIISGRFIIGFFSDTTRANSTVVLDQCLDILETLEGKEEIKGSKRLVGRRAK